MLTEPATYQAMKAVLLAAIIHAGGYIDVTFTDLGEAAIAVDDLGVVVERSAAGARITVRPR